MGYRVSPFICSFGGSVQNPGANTSVVTGGTPSAAGNMTGTAVLTTTPVDCSSFESLAFQPVWTGTPNGTFIILVSLDGINFDNLGASITGNPAGSAGHTYIPIFASCTKWCALQYTNVSGTGQLVVNGVSKTR